MEIIIYFNLLLFLFSNILINDRFYKKKLPRFLYSQLLLINKVIQLFNCHVSIYYVVMKIKENRRKVLIRKLIRTKYKKHIPRLV